MGRGAGGRDERRKEGVKKSEEGWARFSITALLVFQTLFSVFHVLFLKQTSIPKLLSRARKYPKQIQCLIDIDLQKLPFPYPLNTWSYGSFRSLRHSTQNYVQLLGYERSPRLVWNRSVDLEPNMWSCLTGYQPKQMCPRCLYHSVRSNPSLH